MSEQENPCAGCAAQSEGCSGGCSGCSGASADPASFLAPCNALSSVGHLIAVTSGKGGVGKSMVTSQLALAMSSAGLRVGILDADITGPSIPKIFGLHTRAMAGEGGILPVSSRSGIKIMSLNLLTERETDPVVWRGPIIADLVKQFWSDVCWGDLDYLLVDMPPGTGDVPLTVFQSLPVCGIVVVTSPQDLVGMIVGKSVNMARMMEIPILGLIENFSYYQCPDCGGRHSIFGPSHAQEIAMEYHIPLLAQLPIDPALAEASDKGCLENLPQNALAQAAEIIHITVEG